MGDEERSFSMSVPLDSDGFLRRECPTCEREFKWFSSPEGESEPAPDAGYFCPYCAIQAPGGAWHTKTQVELAQGIVTREVIEPEIEKLRRGVAGFGSASGGLIEARVESDPPEERDPLTETDDMRRIDFACHPAEPVKVLDDWDRPVHCLICGAAA